MAQVVSFLRCDVQRARAAAGVAALLMWVASARALPPDQPTSSTMEKKIAQDLQMVRAGEQSGMGPLKMGRLWAHLASDYENEMQLAKSEDAYNHALRLLEGVPEAKIDYAIVLDNLGSMYVMAGNFEDAERCRRRSLTARELLGDRLEIARGKSHLAEVELGRHRFKEAEEQSREAYDEMVALKDSDTGDLISVLVTLIYAECTHDGCVDGLEHARKASSLAVAAFAADSLPVGQTHLALGYAEWKAGVKDGPDEEMRAGIEIMKAQTSPGHPYVLSALEQYKAYLSAVHRAPEAKAIERELQVESESRGACMSCTVSVYGLR